MSHPAPQTDRHVSHLYRVLGQAVRPKPIVTVSQWADRHRILSGKDSSEPGPWRTDRIPQLREIMDCLSVTSPVQFVVLRFPAQHGKTAIGLNWIGYVMDHAPGPMLAVVPTLEVRKRWVKQRLDPMLQETAVLRDMLGSRRRDASNAEDMKDFPGGVLIIGGANSAASLASMPIKYSLEDEVDSFPWDVGGEGDPHGLILERSKTFLRRKNLQISSPKKPAEESRIHLAYMAGDQRQYYVPCPHCDTPMLLRWKHDDGTLGLTHSQTTDRVWYVCRHCGAGIEEHQKTAMLAAGSWVPNEPGRSVRSYTINSLYSPLGLGFTWKELWDQYEDAQHDTAKMRRFVNTALAECYEESGDGIDEVGLMARLETYPAKLPILRVTAGVDVQKDRLEISVYGWGEGEECWALDHIIEPGDTAAEDVWENLEPALKEAGVQVVAVDSGYNAGMVYDWVSKRAWAFATKGMDGSHRPLIEDERRRRQKLRAKRRRGVPVYIVGADQGKALLHARTRLEKPGPGYLHFPNDAAFDDEFFAQLAAEMLVKEQRGGRMQLKWKKRRSRNEAMDCWILAIAAHRLAGAPKQAQQKQALRRRQVVKR